MPNSPRFQDKFQYRLITTFLALMVSTPAFSADFEWSGLYRFELVSIDRSELSNNIESNKAYGAHHLILRPKIVAGDGFLIRGQFDIMNSMYNGSLANQVGQIWGNGKGTASDTSMEEANATRDRQAVDQLYVSKLYATIIHEFGELLVGRAPVHFGLGMTYNAGMGEFDHWYDSRDLIAYKISFGNSYLMPSIAKISEGVLHSPADDVTEYGIVFDYKDQDSGLDAGLSYTMRKSSSGNDTPTSITTGGTVTDGLDTNLLSVYGRKKSESLTWGIEFDVKGGNTGVTNSSNEMVSLSGYGVALELAYKQPSSHLGFGLLAGSASGDDPNTSSYEGFAFDRNYDVALLMFNHQLGQLDLLKTTIAGGGVSSPNTLVDVESVSNAAYFAPYFTYQWNERWGTKTSLIYGALNNTTIGAVNVESDLGLELDFQLKYKPHDGLTWLNEFAYLSPGSAFAGGTNAFEKRSIYAWFSKVAISF
ncbi:MAG: hypothetical protein KDD50_12115 [Bdellovibrionales bacterium]|nr:hypothetical protein [Bdellovibrionales bacterium]